MQDSLSAPVQGAPPLRQEAKVVFKVPLILTRFILESHPNSQRLTRSRPRRFFTATGVDRGCVSPVPSCPYSLFPQAHTFPDSLRARLWKAPTAIVLMFTKPFTCVGTEICLLCETIMHTSHKMMRSLLSNAPSFLETIRKMCLNRILFSLHPLRVRYETRNKCKIISKYKLCWEPFAL